MHSGFDHFVNECTRQKYAEQHLLHPHLASMLACLSHPCVYDEPASVGCCSGCVHAVGYLVLRLNSLMHSPLQLMPDALQA